MQTLSWIIAGFFLPLFPLSMVFNAVFQRVRVAWLRLVVLLLWPLPGVWLLHKLAPDIPDWLPPWAILTAALYAMRAVVVRELGVWAGFLATSSWAMSWIPLATGGAVDRMLLQVLTFSLPLALLVLLTAELERRYESAYAGIVSGIAQAQPRLSVILVMTTLAVIGSPLFPAFFSMLTNITDTVMVLPAIAAGVVTVWLLWSWSGIRVLQELLVGPASAQRHEDVSQWMAMIYGVLLLVLVSSSLYLSGVLL